MAKFLSLVATLQAAALIRGPGAGSHAPASGGNLRILDDSASVAVGAPAVLAASDYIRFGKIPAGAVIVPNLSYLSSDHTATVAGKLQLVPLDGSAVQEITGVVVNLETSETTSVPDVAASLTVAKESWIQFVPTADLTIATTAKTMRARIVYAQAY